MQESEAGFGKKEKAKKSNQAYNAMYAANERVGKRLSKKERREDALALRAEERRDKLRKAMGRCK